MSPWLWCWWLLAQPDAKGQAAVWVDQGNAKHQAGEHADALALYEAAFAAFPSPKLHLNLAETHRALGHWDRAHAHYGRFLEEASPAPNLQMEVQARRQALEPRLGRFELRSTATTAVAKMDQGPVPLNTLIWVMPGEHQITAQAEGYQPFETHVQAIAGQTTSVVLAFAPINLAIPPPPPPTIATKSEAPPEPETRWWLWASLGAAALVTLSVVLAVSAGGKEFVPDGELGRSHVDTWERF